MVRDWPAPQPAEWELIEVDMPNKYITKERLWLNRDKSAVVKDGDPDAAFLLASPGKEVPAADVERYGLDAPAAADKPGNGPKPKGGAAAKAQPPAEDKAVKAPAATKSKDKA